jgi:hypothetical protein
MPSSSKDQVDKGVKGESRPSSPSHRSKKDDRDTKMIKILSPVKEDKGKVKDLSFLDLLKHLKLKTSESVTVSKDESPLIVEAFKTYVKDKFEDDQLKKLKVEEKTKSSTSVDSPPAGGLPGPTKEQTKAILKMTPESDTPTEGTMSEDTSSSQDYMKASTKSTMPVDDPLDDDEDDDSEEYEKSQEKSKKSGKGRK